MQQNSSPNNNKMHMSYYLSSTVYDFFFKGVNVTTTWGMVSLCLGLMSLSVVMEGFKVARSQLMKLSQSRRLGTSRYGPSERSPLIVSQSVLARRNEKLLFGRRVRFHILQTFLHLIHLTIGYLLMLAVMSYNGYFTIAVVGGAGIGYYCFSLFDLPGKLLGTAAPAPAKVVPASEDFLHPTSGDKTAALLPEGKCGTCPDEC
ncbi:high affinity copper uptake protein 1-like isoform X1 [Macrobrachium nipponense]|uniref:high affinity copper uptake protein 1-like isoform X1 n=2 Tax=Macrobrachium nipponense TaxID=159736 RepID=UPI0030C87708